ncbi:hypothetical protein [Nocardia sp. alder85J]|uniref:hypothetical protein n=1 Tax=Nocardia sp. alder85J TaxID=2862949 RepID=UPI001CD740EA|nr:hypothetical protein [Nocardia sp. alder85J]MCX4093071.1 hypothetical protein [Nocardia sp. alder85J]
MAPDPSLTDDTGWSGLSTTARNGDLMLEPGVAETAANHVLDALNSIVGAHQWIQQNLQLASPTVASTASGTALAGVFHKKIATDLEDRMIKHQNILTDMGNAFVEAGKAYAAAETTSAQNFGAQVTALSNMSFSNPTGTAPAGSPFIQALPPRGTPNWPGTPMDSVSITPELGSTLQWEQLYQIGQSIDAQGVANAGGVWYWLAQLVLQPTFDTLKQNISGLSSQWTGSGATASINATTKYTTESKTLTDDMNKLGDLLIFTADWLQNTKTSMPQTETPPTTSSSGATLTPADSQALLLQYQNAFNTSYYDNFSGTTNNVVALTDPNPVTNGNVNSNTQTTNANPNDFSSGYGDTTPSNSEYTPSNTSGGSGGSSNGNSGGTGGDTSSGSTGTGDTGTGTTGSGTTGTGTGTDTGTGTGLGDTGTGTTGSGTTGTDGTGTGTGLGDTATSGLDALSGLNGDKLADPAGNFAGNPMLGGNPLGRAADDLARAERGLLGGLGKGALGRAGEALAAEEKLLQDESKLFPRSKLPLEAERLGRAGAAEGREPGFPFGGSPQGKKDEEKERKRSDLLNSTEHLDEAIGPLDPSIRPVLDR